MNQSRVEDSNEKPPETKKSKPTEPTEVDPDTVEPAKFKSWVQKELERPADDDALFAWSGWMYRYRSVVTFEWHVNPSYRGKHPDPVASPVAWVALPDAGKIFREAWPHNLNDQGITPERRLELAKYYVYASQITSYWQWNKYLLGWKPEQELDGEPKIQDKKLKD